MKRLFPNLRKLLSLCLALMLLIVTGAASAEGLFPSLSQMFGTAMPSLGEALGRYPDEEISNADGSTEVFRDVTETDFNTFSVYLSGQEAAFADYQVAGNSFSASIQVDGKTISFTYDTQTQEAKITYPKGTNDEWLDYAKTQFESAVQLLEAGETDEAMSGLFSIPNYNSYRPIAEYFAAHPELAAAEKAAREEKLAPYRNVGGYVTFGKYEQDNNTANGKEPVEWLVLDYDAAGNRALLISRYGLDSKPYNTEWERIAWEECTLRAWLNGTFLNEAFTSQEQTGILLTNVDNSRNQGYSELSTSGGNDTRDRIFLLSYAEANKYLGVTWEDSNNMKPMISPTAYALAAGAYTSDYYRTAEGEATGWWWLRSPGRAQFSAVLVNNGGSLCDYGAGTDGSCVRPTLWIDLTSDIF